ncbi:hypothetical protein DL990_22050 [Amycolatopsis sp. WAC 01416]|nr:hypothetical protein DL990_22050 [Amycolatopsis sp. WAC 01416]
MRPVAIFLVGELCEFDAEANVLLDDDYPGVDPIRSVLSDRRTGLSRKIELGYRTDGTPDRQEPSADSS